MHYSGNNNILELRILLKVNLLLYLNMPNLDLFKFNSISSIAKLTIHWRMYYLNSSSQTLSANLNAKSVYECKLGIKKLVISSKYV